MRFFFILITDDISESWFVLQIFGNCAATNWKISSEVNFDKSRFALLYEVSGIYTMSVFCLALLQSVISSASQCSCHFSDISFHSVLHLIIYFGLFYQIKSVHLLSL